MLCSHTTRSRHRPARRGFSLVELLIATLLIVIIFLGWLQIANFQAIRKESLRRLALEKAAGYLDVMSQLRPGAGQYRINFDGDTYMAVVEQSALPLPLFTNANESSSSPGYVLRVMPTSQITSILPHQDWPPAGRWALIELYDQHSLPTNESGRVFSRLSVFLGDLP
jgi:prepilin-type N-terminal cleavage/methylation domain-containing protein